MRRLHLTFVMIGLLGVLLVQGTATTLQAAPKSKPAAAKSEAPQPPVNVNITLNVHVGHQTKVEIAVDAPFTPMIGSLELPEAIQKLIGGLWGIKPDPHKAKPERKSAKPAAGE